MLSYSCQPQSLSSLNATTVIHRLHVMNRQNEKKEEIIKRQLDSEVRKTTYKVKIRKFNKNVDISKILQCRQNKGHENGFFSDTARSTGENQDFKSFDQFLKKKRVHNAFLKSKMKLFGNSISDRAKAQIEREINKQITLIDQKKALSATSQIKRYSTKTLIGSQRNRIKEITDPEKLRKLKKMTVSHMVLDKLLGLMIENPKFICLKYQNQELFKSLKEQILNIIINNEKVVDAIQTLENDMRLTKMQQFKFSWAKLKQVQLSRKPFYLLQEQQKDELSEQINKTLHTLSQIIQNSLQDFNRQNKRLYNIKAVEKVETNKKQRDDIKIRRSIRKSMTSLTKQRIQLLKKSINKDQGQNQNQNKENKENSMKSNYNNICRFSGIVHTQFQSAS